MGAGVSQTEGRYSTDTITEASHAKAAKHPSGDFFEGGAPTAGSGAREVDIAGGTVWALGATDTLSASTVSLPENTSGQPRVDTIVLTCDYTANDSAVGYVQGTPGANPVPPSLNRSAGTTWQVPICDVTVANGAGVLPQSAIVDVRRGPWIPLTLIGNWYQYAAPWAVARRRVVGDHIYFRGLIRTNAAINTITEPLVPVPYRFGWPERLILNRTAAHDNQSGFTSGNPHTIADHARIDYFPDDGGRLVWRYPIQGAAFTSRWISLDGVAFDFYGNGRL